MPRVGENIYHRKDGRWEGRFVKARENGRTRFGYVFARTYRETKELLASARIRWKEAAEKEKQAVTSMENIGSAWLQNLEKTLKASTIAKYRDYLIRYIYPRFGRTAMSQISSCDISEFCQYLLKEGSAKGKSLSPKTVTEILRVLKQLRKYAMSRSWAVGYAGDCISIRQKTRPMRVFSLKEREILQSYLEENRTPICLGILLCLLTGLRIGEICALTWDDVSLEEKTVLVNKTLQRIPNLSADRKTKTIIVVTPPKSECSIRTIPLPDQLCQVLQTERKPGAYLLTGDKERFLEPRSIQNRFKSVLNICGIEHANFHALRHTFATTWVEAGLDVKCLSVILGHADVSITLNRYVHPSMSLKRKNMEQMLSFRP